MAAESLTSIGGPLTPRKDETFTPFNSWKDVAGWRVSTMQVTNVTFPGAALRCAGHFRTHFYRPGSSGPCGEGERQPLWPGTGAACPCTTRRATLTPNAGVQAKLPWGGLQKRTGRSASQDAVSRQAEGKPGSGAARAPHGPNHTAIVTAQPERGRVLSRVIRAGIPAALGLRSGTAGNGSRSSGSR